MWLRPPGGWEVQLRASSLSRFLIAALGLTVVLALAPTGAAVGVAPPGGTCLPPAYLAWRTGGLPPGLGPKLTGLPGVEHAVVVAGDTAWMVRSARRGGAIVDRAPAPFAIPIDALAAKGSELGPFLPQAYRADVLSALAQGRGVLGSTSASLRRLKVGDRMTFRGGARVTVGAVVPDPVAAWSELLVSRAAAAALHVRTPRFALLQMKGHPGEATLASRVRRLAGPGYPVRVRGPGRARFRRHADSTWPQVLMKVGFGEFVARPYPGRPGYLQMGGTFARRHLASRRVPLLGSTTCNRVVFAPLTAAMNELRRRGLSGLIHGYAGCFASRTVMRRPNGSPSHHAWGAAVDINAAQNPYGARPRQDPRLVAVMRRHGFSWGGSWTVPDGMHFEYEVPGIAPPARP